jgi:hypothetical protein
MRHISLTLGAVVLLAATATADQYARRDGSTFEGTVLSAGADSVRFRLAGGEEHHRAQGE